MLFSIIISEVLSGGTSDLNLDTFLFLCFVALLPYKVWLPPTTVFLLWAPQKRAKSAHNVWVLGVIHHGGWHTWGHLSNSTRETSFLC